MNVMTPMAGRVTAQRITQVRLWHVPLTSHTAYYMADGKTCDTVGKRGNRGGHRYRPDRLGRGLPDSALPARLCARRGPGAGGTGAGDPRGRTRWGLVH